ncbi:MAG: hypothetical protein ABSH44_01270 [Bryobacteraceae bacterium]|jgi:hypothetical protein
MKHSLFLLMAAGLAVSPCLAQTGHDISLAEFRQTLSDFMTAGDVYRGTNYAPALASVPDETLAKWYTAVPDGRRFQTAVNKIKASVEGMRQAPVQRRPASQAMAGYPAPRNVTAMAQASQSSPFATGISSYVAPDFSLFPASYPSGPDWSNMVSSLQTLGYMASGDPSSEPCLPDGESALSQATSVMKAIEDFADQICEAIPDPCVVIVGEGTKIPVKEICYAINLILVAFNWAFDALYNDCVDQDNEIIQADIDATWHNTIQLNNLEFRLMVEENLLNTAGPIGKFELPGTQGGYLEYARAILADTIANLALAGVNTASANASMLAGDKAYGGTPANYKLAYENYQTAYGLAVK